MIPRFRHLPYWQRNLYVVWAAVFTAQVAFSIVTPFLPAFVAELGVEDDLPLWSGLVFSVNFLTASLIAPVWGSLSDRYGKKPMMLRAGLGMGLTYFAMATSRSVGQLVFWRAVNGLVSGFIPASNTFIASNTPEEELGRSLGLLQAGGAAGLILGPLVGGAIAAYTGPRGSLIVSGCLLILAALAPYVARLEERSPVRKEQPHVLQDVRESLQNVNLRLLFSVQLLVQAGLLFVQPTLPLYIAQVTTGRVEFITGAIYSLVGVATIIGSPLLARRASRHAPALLTACLAAAAFFNVGQGFSFNPWLLAFFRFLFGLANAGISVSSSLMMALSVPAEERGRTFGLLQSVNALGAVLGPLVGGALGDTFGLRAPFFATAAVLAGSSLLVRSAWPRLEKVSAGVPATPGPQTGAGRTGAA
ncbi:MAG TPA: multidrug efflux MFS transporter [Firmicutes bacterium]|nr:multidrug efflux MFS transporter [Bacillota bacterium]